MLLVVSAVMTHGACGSDGRILTGLVESLVCFGCGFCMQSLIRGVCLGRVAAVGLGLAFKGQ